MELPAYGFSAIEIYLIYKFLYSWKIVSQYTCSLTFLLPFTIWGTKCSKVYD